jgi:transcription initiation factor TFIID subunit 6
VKHILSKELQLYFERVCAAIMDEQNENLRAAALSSLRNDPGLHQLLPYFLQFISEKATHGLKNMFVLNQMMELTHALLENGNLFIEPYVSSSIPNTTALELTFSRPGFITCPSNSHLLDRTTVRRAGLS